MKIEERIDELVKRHGSLRNVEKITGIKASYLCRLRSKKKFWPSDSIVRKLGLKRLTINILYQKIKP